MSAPRKPRLFHPLIFSGLLLFVVGFGASVFALLADVFLEQKNVYQGLLTFVLYPAVMVLGLVLFVLGRIFTRREYWSVPAPPVTPEARRRNRRLAVLLAAFASVFIGFSAVGAFRTYKYTESEDFCGALCHEPMQPQHVAHQNSPHASVECVECHVGDGAAGYIDAKISGIHQMRQMLAGSYPRPIRVHPHKLPGVTSSCESCHWPERVLGVRHDNRVRFGYDLRNTERRLHTALKVGTGASEKGAGRSGTGPWGAHWHAAPETRVFFEATDERKLEIDWVKIERLDGTETIYTRVEDETDEPSASETAGSEAEGSEAEGSEAVARSEGGTTGSLADASAPRGENARLMDCLDCHNRPAHRFPTPDTAIDEALASGRLPTSLPMLKKLAVEILSTQFESSETVATDIRERIDAFYGDHFGGTVLERRETLDAAALEIELLYRRTVFPEMKVNGYTYPSHAGHRDSPGCFRCHDGKLVSAAGEVLPSDCALCHDFYSTDPASKDLVEIPADGSSLHPFAHPAHAEETCWSCHSGAASPYASCARCHEKQLGPHERHFECSMCHRPGEVKPPAKTCSPCHPVGESALHRVAEHGDCATCHQPHSWSVSYEAACRECHPKLGADSWETHHPGEACSPCHDFRGVDAHLLGLPFSREGSARE